MLIESGRSPDEPGILPFLLRSTRVILTHNDAERSSHFPYDMQHCVISSKGVFTKSPFHWLKQAFKILIMPYSDDP